uniref:Uncharacterized protein n=1 Tax=Anguilla anguilla TaxID=7936 RepID=A0A0E9SMJ2_ANGAN
MKSIRTYKFLYSSVVAINRNHRAYIGLSDCNCSMYCFHLAKCKVDGFTELSQQLSSP